MPGMVRRKPKVTGSSTLARLDAGAFEFGDLGVVGVDQVQVGADAQLRAGIASKRSADRAERLPA